MVRAATLLRRLLCLGMAFALLVPAAAWGAHSLRHGPVAAAAAAPDAHQYSTGTGTHRNDGEPARDKQDGGHDHQLSLSVPVAALFGEARLVHPPRIVAAPPEIRVRRLTLRPAEPPPADPPRSA